MHGNRRRDADRRRRRSSGVLRLGNTAGRTSRRSSRRPTTSAGARRSPTGSSRSSARASCPLRRGRGCMRSPSSPTRGSWTTSLPRRTRLPLPPPQVDAAAARSPMPAQAAAAVDARTARPPLKGRAVRGQVAGAMKTRDAASARIARLKGRPWRSRFHHGGVTAFFVYAPLRAREPSPYPIVRHITVIVQRIASGILHKSFLINLRGPRCYSWNITASCVASPAGKREYPKGDGKPKERKRR